jgi:CheY-like chemotaxis protein
MESVKPRKPRVLAVDDEASLRHVIRFTLECAGYSVAIAADGDEAWQMLQAGDYHCIVTDYQMPNMTGEELCRRMRQVDRLRNVPVVLLTGRAFDLHRDALVAEVGIREFLPKPFSPRALVAAVRSLLDANALPG